MDKPNKYDMFYCQKIWRWYTRSPLPRHFWKGHPLMFIGSTQTLDNMSCLLVMSVGLAKLLRLEPWTLHRFLISVISWLVLQTTQQRNYRMQNRAQHSTVMQSQMQVKFGTQLLNPWVATKFQERGPFTVRVSFPPQLWILRCLLMNKIPCHIFKIAWPNHTWRH